MHNPAASILIVDDELLNRKLLETLLKPEGYRTTSVSNGEDALVSIALDKPDLILLDVMMPGLDGYQVTKRLKSNNETSNIPIIMVTALVDREARLLALDAGVEDFLTKPVDRLELWLRVRNLLRLKIMSDIVKSHSTILEERVRERTAELQKSEEEFRSLAESMPQIVWVTRPDGGYIYFNRQWMDYTGLTLEESLGDGWNKPFHPDDRQLAWDAWQNATKHNHIYSMESRLRRADGTYRWWLLRGVPVHDDTGKILKWFGTCTDIHNLKLAELEITNTNLELRESERRYSDMLENVELLSVMLDREGRITYCNDYLLRLTGWQRKNIIGLDWFGLFLPAESQDLKDTFFPAVLADQPETRHLENVILTRSGERRLIRWNNSLLRSSANEVVGVASIGEDITERKNAEARVAYLSRVHTLLSSINALIVRTLDRNDLFRSACQIATEAGGFYMAMMFMVDPLSNKIVPVATAGKNEELLTDIKDLLASSENSSKIMAALAIREKKAVVSNDLSSDPKVLFGKKYAESGVCSMVVLPLIVSGESVGALALYAGELDFFHEDELKLLKELAGDISFAIDYIEKQDRINYLAYYDVLTGLANRSLFLERVAQNMRSAVSSGHKLALCIIDLERFKNINDSLGRPAGDALLKQVSEWLTKETGDVNLLAHIDADHFAMLVPDVSQEADLVRQIKKMFLAFLEHPFLLNDSAFRIAAKVGIALFPSDSDNAEILFGNAEAALKKAKAGGDRYLFYTQKMNEAVSSKLKLENQLRQAIDNGEFVLHYQPKVNIASGKITSAEALIRWNDPCTGLVPPGQFIPLLEETGMIYEVGSWALRKAVEDNLRWQNAGLPAVRIAVNMSAVQLRNPGFIAEIEQVIGKDTNAAAGLELEITESLVMENVEYSIASLKAIRAMGITLAIDDFGTGFSSLSYLAKLPVTTLKIDRAFVIEMKVDQEGLALVSAIINMAHSLKLKVVAEGVETEEQLRLLRLLECDEIQGFLFSKAVPVDVFESRFLAHM